MRYYIDGYNFLFHVFDEVDPLNEKREEVIAHIQEILTSLNLKLTIIFDGHSNHDSFFPSSFNRLGVEIVYTASKQTADQFILENLSFGNKNSEKTIVTSDNFLAKESRKLGAHTLSIESFLKSIRKKTKNKSEEKVNESSSFDHKRWLEIFERTLDD